MKAPHGLDHAYRERIKDDRVRRLMLDVFGGERGIAQLRADIEVHRAIRFAAGRATKCDSLMRDLHKRRARSAKRRLPRTTANDY